MHVGPRFVTALVSLSCLVNLSLAKAVPAQSAKSIPILVITEPEKPKRSSATSRLLGLLDGLGIPYHERRISDQNVSRVDRYDLVIAMPGFVSEPGFRNRLSQDLKQALQKGVNVIYIGSSFCGNADTGLSKLFHVSRNESGCLSKGSQLPSLSLDLTSYGLAGRELTVHAEESVMAMTSGSQSIDRLVRETGGRHQVGNAVLVGFDILSFWKHPEDLSAYLRPLLLTRLINRQLNNGYVAKHGSINAHQSPFMLRWEDVSPLPGSDTQQPFLAALPRFEALLGQASIPLNIAIVSRFVDPLNRIQADWSDQTPANKLLRAFVRSQLSKGASLIAHGYTHQFGDTPNDRSKADGEMWDEARESFLTTEQQRQRVSSARDAIIQDWQQAPLIWETPHYQANSDTYQVVADAGFRFVVESDSSLFPNRVGYDSRLDRRLLNLPETAYEVPLDHLAIQQRQDLWWRAIQPDLYEIGAPFLFFYHGMSEPQLDALGSLVQSVNRFDYWKPTLREYAEFWLMRERAQHRVVHEPDLKRFLVSIDNGFAGHTLRIRLPDGFAPESVSLDAKAKPLISRRFDQAWFVYVPMTDRSNQMMTINYRPES